MDVVLALGFDLFFKPKINAAAATVGVEVRYLSASDAARALPPAVRVIADVSTPGVEDALVAIRAAHPRLPILACYPHVEAQRAIAVRALGGTAVTRGAFADRIADALAGRMT